MRQVVDVSGGMRGKAREREEGRREGEGIGQWGEREGSRSIQSRKKSLQPRP